jgi:kumamolisin
LIVAPDGEETLDVEWASGIAPGATIKVYASGSLSFVDLDRALDRIITDVRGGQGIRQLSISLGLGEKYMPAGEAQIESDKFLTLAALGVNVFVSSGDAGSNPDGTGHSATGDLQVECSSSDPSVIGVGGTSLTLTPAGAVADEEGWVSSGGGVSIVFDRPAWQKGDGVPAGNKRCVPDVSLTADPDRGAVVILHGSQDQYGGTSWSAPAWAGLCALMNEAREKASKPPLPFLNPLIYPLIGQQSFRDITAGSNGAYTAGKGYDMVTGVGVPNVKKLIDALTR